MNFINSKELVFKYNFDKNTIVYVDNANIRENKRF